LKWHLKLHLLNVSEWTFLWFCFVCYVLFINYIGTLLCFVFISFNFCSTIISFYFSFLFLLLDPTCGPCFCFGSHFAISVFILGSNFWFLPSFHFLLLFFASCLWLLFSFHFLFLALVGFSFFASISYFLLMDIT